MYQKKGIWKHRITNIDVVKREADCTNCGKAKIVKRDKNRWMCKNSKKLSNFIKSKSKTYREHCKDECERCGFVPEHKCQLDIHHKDNNHLNDDVKNLQTLCANCHRLQRVGLLV